MHMTVTTPHAITYTLNGDFESIKAMNSQSFIEKDNLGRNAIHAACFKGYHAILTYMLTELGDSGKEAGLTTDFDGNTPAHYCCGREWK